MSEKMSSAPGNNAEAQLSKLLKEYEQLGLETTNEEGFQGYPIEAKIALLKMAIQMHKQLHEKDEHKRKLEEQLHEKDEQLHEKDEQLHEKDEQLHEQKSVAQLTIKNTYYTYTENGEKGDFYLPTLKLNKAVHPSVGGHERTTTIRDDDGNVKTVQLTIPEAKIEECGEGMWIDNMKEVGFPTIDGNGYVIASSLAQKVADTKGGGLSYVNEFGVQRYCEDLVKDALRVLGLTGNLVETHFEVSIYLLKPDIILVLKHRGRIMFVVEVKSPEHEDDDEKKNAVFGSENVAGQIWSYLYAMKASGVKVPMGAIMTYNRIAIVTLDDLSEDKDHLKKVQKARDDLSEDTMPDRTLEKKESEACYTRTESPAKAAKPFVETNARNDNQMKRNVYIDVDENENTVVLEEVSKAVFRSKIFEKGDVFPCLVQALHIAYQYAEMDQETQLVRVEHGDPIGERLVFYVGPASYNWKKMPSKTSNGREFVAIVENKVPNRYNKFFCILGSLGDGGKATVYLACSTGGKVCAIKDYWLTPSSASLTAEREQEEEKSREALYKKAVAEAERWGTIYENRFTARVSHLGGKASLIMPYGYGITEPQDRLLLVPAIRDELQRLADMGFVYEKNDLRWRHVLLDRDGKVFFCDLESLELLADGADRSEAVYEQLLILFRPMFAEAAIDINDILKKVKENFDGFTNAMNKDKTLMAFLPQVDEAKVLFQNDNEGELSLKEKALLCLFQLALDSKDWTSVPELWASKKRPRAVSNVSSSSDPPL